MTTKTVVTTDSGDVSIRTVNGVTTSTTAIYPFEVHTPAFNSVGVDVALLDLVLSQIRAAPMLWNQNHWRNLFTDQYTFTSAVNRSRVTFGSEYADAYQALPAAQQRCGAAMCMAGWAAEIARADWLIDRDLALVVGNDAWSNMILVPFSDLAADFDVPAPGQLSRGATSHISPGQFPTAVFASLRRRGFVPDDPHAQPTHGMVTASVYACAKLGIGYDLLGMFAGDLTLAWVELFADLYRRYGSSLLPRDLLEELNEVDEEERANESSPWPEQLRQHYLQGADTTAASA